MSFIIAAGVVGTLIVGYVGRKGWLAFHRAVGITPGKLTYIEPSQLPPPQMIQLELTEQQVSGLPFGLIQQLQRIDNKADVYQQWKNELIASGQTPVVNEDEFVIKKILDVRLPEMLDSYHRIARHQSRLQTSHHFQDSSHYQQVSNVFKPSLNDEVESQDYTVQNESDALSLLIEVMNKTESKLDTLLKACQSSSLDEMKVMRRYLDNRQ